MFDCDTSLFEQKDNELIFKETCEKLKNHPFESPWKCCFSTVKTENQDFMCRMHEFNLPELVDLNVPNFEFADNVTNSSAVVIHHEKDVSSELFEAKLLILRESLLNVQKTSSSEHIKGIEILNTVCLSQVPELCNVLHSSFSSETNMTLFLNAVLSLEKPLSLSIANALVKSIIYPLVFAVKQNSSRNLLAAVLNFSTAYPKPIIDEVIAPCLKTPSLETLQLETVLKMVKSNLPNEYVCYCIKNILEQAVPADNVFSTIQNLVERKIHHDKNLHEVLAWKMESWSSVCQKNMKFTKLLISILSSYGNELDEQQIAKYKEVIKKNETIMKRAAENVLKKLK